MVTDIGPSTVETVAVRDSVRYSFQRKGFYAKGYHWAFYYASGAIYWRKSADGINWSTPAVDITPEGEAPTEGAEIAVWLDRHEEPAHHPYIIYADHDTDSPIYFRRGTIDDAGDLTWDATWQIAKPLIIGVSFKNITICVDDTNGYPFIGFTETTRAEPGTNSTPKVIHSQQMDGTWSTEWIKQLNVTNDTSWVCIVVPSGGPTIMAVYERDSNEIKYNVYTIGATWTGELGAGVTIGPDAAKISVTSQRAGRPVADTKRAHIAYCDGNENLQHIRIDAFGVVGPTLIYASAAAMAPSISTKIYGGTVNNYRTLYVFWTPTTDEPTADYVCYKKSVDAGLNWTKEDGGIGVEEWVDETGAGLSGVNIASSYFEEQRHFKVTGGGSLPESYIGILYTNKGASPDYVRWAGLEFADPDEDLLGEFHAGQDSQNLLGEFHAGQESQNLLGEFHAGQDSQNLLGEFHAGQDSQNLLGRFEAQATADLLGEAEIQWSGSAVLLGKVDITHSADLLGKFDVGQDSQNLLGEVDITHSVDLLGKVDITHSADLLGEFHVGEYSQNLLGKVDITHSANLLGKFEAQATADLLGKFEAQATADLLGKVDITHSADLLGKFEAQSTADLLGRFEVGQDSQNLLGKVDITHSADLLGKFDVGQDSQNLLGKFDIGQDSQNLLGRFEAQATADLLGKVDITHSADLLGKVDITHSADLLGKFEAQSTADLLGKFEVGQDSQNLLGEFHAGQDSQNLLGEFHVGQDSQNLLGRFEAQATADLLGRVDITHSADLLGRFEAQATADLLGRFDVGQDSQNLLGKVDITHSADLLGKFHAGQDSQNLLGKVDITHSADLLGKFRTSTPGWIVQGVSVEAYIILDIVV